MVPVTVVVVSYNTQEKLSRCLVALSDIAQVIVVDNASVDGSPDMVERDFPRVQLVRLSENIGFGPANNVGWDRATQPLVLFLNSDAYADPGAIADLMTAFDDPTVVAAGGQLLNPDRTLQDSTANRLTLWAVFCEQSWLEKAFPPGPYWTTRRLALSSSSSESEQVMGACLMVRRELPERWDERFFLYCEDTDLCLRLRRLGRILYVPSAKFVHDLGSSSADRRWLAVARYNRGKELYFRIHHGGMASGLVWLMNRLGATLRLGFWALRGRRDQVSLWWRVLRASKESR